MTRRGRRHGTNSCYCGGCRRDECRAAHTAYARSRVESWRRQIAWERAERLVAALEAALAEEPSDEVERRGLTLALERHRRTLVALEDSEMRS